MMEYLLRFKVILERLEQAGLKAKPGNCQYVKNKMAYLGHIISEVKVQPQQNKIDAVEGFPQPRTFKQIQSFLGLAGYYRSHIPNFAKLASPLTELTRKKHPFIWKDKCEKSFQEFKTKLTSYPVMQLVDWKKNLFLTTDASNYAIGAVLEQEFDWKRLPIAYASWK